MEHERPTGRTLYELCMRALEFAQLYGDVQICHTVSVSVWEPSMIGHVL